MSLGGEMRHIADQQNPKHLQLARRLMSLPASLLPWMIALVRCRQRHLPNERPVPSACVLSNEYGVQCREPVPRRDRPHAACLSGILLLSFLACIASEARAAEKADLDAIRRFAAVDPDACIKRCRKVIDEATEADPVPARVYYFLTQSYLLSEKLPESLDSSAAGLKLAKEAGDDLLYANLTLFRSIVLHQLNRLSEAQEICVAGIEAARRVPNVRLEAKLESERANNLVELGDLTKGLAAYRRALDIAQSNGADDIAFTVMVNLATATDDLTQSDDLEATYRRFLDDVSAYDNPIWAATLRLNLGSILLINGKPAEAEACLLQVVEEAGSVRAPFVLAKAWSELAQALVEQDGGEDRIQTCLQMARWHARQAGDSSLESTIETQMKINGVDGIRAVELLLQTLEERYSQVAGVESALQRRELLSALIDCQKALGNWERVVELMEDRHELLTRLYDDSTRSEISRLSELLRSTALDAASERSRAEDLATLRENESRVRWLYGIVIGFACVGGFVATLSAFRRRARKRQLRLQNKIDAVLQDAVTNWETTFDALENPICVVNAKGQITRANKAFSTRFTDGREFVNASDFEEVCRRHFEFTGSARDLRGKLQTRRAETNFEQWFEAHTTSIQLRGDSSDLLVVFQDVTGDHLYRQEVLENNIQAENEARRKSEFMAVVSHEIRTPLNAISGTLQLLRDRSLKPDEQELLRISSMSASQLTRMIEDLLDFSRLETGKFLLMNEPFALHATVRDTVAIFDHDDCDLEFEIAIGDDVPACVLGDHARYRQVLTNLVGNAVQHTDSGQITVQLSSEQADDGSLRIKTIVIDTGAGIAAENHSRIFQPFEQAHNVNTRGHGGAGLGLAICRNLVALMKGEIGFTSEVGRGAEFSFWFPTTAVDSTLQPTTDEESRPIERLHILLVDDEPVNRIIVRRILESLNQDVRCASDGASALAALAEPEAEFDVVVLDLMMPDMSGFEVAQEIRSTTSESELPIVALTAKVTDDDRNACRAFGMNAFLAKPVDRLELQSVLRQFRSRSRVGERRIEADS